MPCAPVDELRRGESSRVLVLEGWGARSFKLQHEARQRSIASARAAHCIDRVPTVRETLDPPGGRSDHVRRRQPAPRSPAPGGEVSQGSMVTVGGTVALRACSIDEPLGPSARGHHARARTVRASAESGANRVGPTLAVHVLVRLVPMASYSGDRGSSAGQRYPAQASPCQS